LKIGRRFGFWIYVAPLYLAWTFGSAAQAKNTLNCTIVDESGKPVAKQELTLTSAGGKQAAKKSDDKGEVKFTGLDDGTYTLGAKDAVNDKVEVSGNTEKACKYTVVSANSANARLQEVMQLMQQKKYAEAEESGKKLVQLMPGEGASHLVLAMAYAYQGNEAAQAEIKKAAELDPQKYQDKVPLIEAQVATYYYNQAAAYGRSNNFDQALKAIDKAIQLKPDDAEAQQLKIRLQDMYLKQMDQKLEKK
jgi:tetratricopeptide (TPR) repeat protein